MVFVVETQYLPVLSNSVLENEAKNRADLNSEKSPILPKRNGLAVERGSSVSSVSRLSIIESLSYPRRVVFQLL